VLLVDALISISWFTAYVFNVNDVSIEANKLN